MTLLVQLAGALAAGLVLIVILRQFAPVPIAAVVVIPVALALIQGPPNLRQALGGFGDVRKEFRPLSAADAAVRGGAPFANVDFLAWAGRRIGPQDRFHLIISERTAQLGAAQWAKYQLAPRLAVERPEEADWIVFYDRGPTPDYPVALFDRPRTFAPRYLLARRRSAG